MRKMVHLPLAIAILKTTTTGIMGVAVANYNSAELALVSSIVWEEANALLQVNAPTPTIWYSILKGGFAGEGNLDADPLFINAATDNYQLQACSPAINAGLAWIGSLTYDILGNNRPAFGGFDMGAYERQAAQPQILYVDSTATGIGDGSSWANAFKTLEAALAAIKNCGAANTIHIAKGTYTAPEGTKFIFDKLNAIVLGGFPSGGGIRNADANPVIIKGHADVLKSLQLDGVKLFIPIPANPI
jgi:trimeric autotransporter adhesin